MSSGFQIEMRLVFVEDGAEAPQSYMGVGGYKVSPEMISNEDKLDKTRIRFHMVADELLNKAHMRLTDEGKSVDDLNNEIVTADQVNHFSDLIRAGKYNTSAELQSLDDDVKKITFTLTTREEDN